jgi:type VI protein secretion system component VasK
MNMCSFVFMQLRNISGWKKVIIIMAFFNVLIFTIDLIAVVLYGTQIRLAAAWLFGSDDKTTLSSLLFIEGALIIGTGALLAGGFAEGRMHAPRGSSAPYATEKLSKERAEFREAQISTGLLLMLTGLPLIILSIISAVA